MADSKKEVQTTMTRIRQYDGYRGKPIFEKKGAVDECVYYNSILDKQCKVPLRNIEEVLEELGLKEENE